MAKAIGVVKLIGIAGFVEGEEFIVHVGQTVTVGRSRECDISLRNCKKYLAVDPDQSNSAEHFRSVSRTHSTIEVKGPDEIYIRDNSSNGTFVDGRRLKTKGALIKNLNITSHEIKLGTTETIRIEWRELVPRKKIKYVKVFDGEKPPTGATEFAGDEADLPAETLADTLADLSPSDRGKKRGKRRGLRSADGADARAKIDANSAAVKSRLDGDGDEADGDAEAAEVGAGSKKLNRRLSRKKAKE